MRARLGLLGATLLLTAAVYAPSISFEFTNWDDPAYVAANREVATLDLDSLRRVFDPRNRVVSEWTPIVTASHQIERAIFGGGPRAAHAGNLLLHLVCVVLVWRLLTVAGAPLAIVFPAALLFALHPLQVESVAWVSGRKTLLATAFSLASLLLFLSGPLRPTRLLAAFALFLLALGSKATAVVLPLWVLAGVWILDRPRLRPLLPWLGALLVVAAARGLMTLEMQADATRAAREAGLAARIEIAGPVLLSYLRQIFWPADLCAHYSWSPSVGAGLLAWAGIAVLVALLVRPARADRRIAFFGAFTAIALLPTVNVLAAPHYQADRYLYAALPGIACVLTALIGRAPRSGPVPAAVIVCVFALGLAPVTRARTEVWRDAPSLWYDTVACDPDFAAGWSNLGLAEIDAGLADEAEGRFLRALEIDPGHLPAWANLGELYARAGRRDEAKRVFREGLDHGAHPDLLNNLAWLLLEDDPREAERLAAAAVALDAGHAAAWDTLGAARLRLGDAEGARSALERGVALRPALPDLRYHLAEALLALGDSAGARREARQALLLLGEKGAPWVEQARRLTR